MQSPRSPSRARPSLSARPAVACGCAGRRSPAGARRVASTRPSPACAPACAGRAWPGSAGPTARCTAGFGRGGLLTCARPSRTVRASARRLGGRARDVKPDLLGKQLHSFSNNLKHTLSTSNKIVSNVRLVTCAARIPALRPAPCGALHAPFSSQDGPPCDTVAACEGAAFSAAPCLPRAARG